MVPNENAIVLFRFSENRWINAIIDGELSFSCAEAYVKQAMNTENEIQGDRYEGIFARLKPDDVRISEMEKLLGEDLIKIPDDGFVLLRRRSAMLRPIFCIYGYRAVDALKDCDEGVQIGENEIRHTFDPKMFSGFAYGDWNNKVLADDRRFTVLTLYPAPFVNRIKTAMIKNNLSYKMGVVDYDLQSSDTFFIEPTDEYNELFCKRPQYAYQHEVRVCLKRTRLSCHTERYPLTIGKLDDQEYRKTHEPFYFVLKAVLAKRDEV